MVQPPNSLPINIKPQSSKNILMHPSAKDTDRPGKNDFIITVNPVVPPGAKFKGIHK